MSRKPKAPRTIDGWCEVLDTMLEWCDERGVCTPADHAAADAVRSLVSFFCDETRRQALHTCNVLVGAGQPSGPLLELRSAIILVFRGGEEAGGKVSSIDYAEGSRKLLAHAVNLGAILGVPNAATVARDALDKGTRGGRQDHRYPEPGFARQLALGSVAACHRELARLSHADLVKLLAARGVQASPQNLARFERGLPWKGANLTALALCLGTRDDLLRRRANVAFTLAATFASKVGAEDSERWFAQLVSIYGDNTARAYLTITAPAAVNTADERLPP